MRILHKFNKVIIVLVLSLIFYSCSSKKEGELKLGIYKAVLLNKDNVQIPFIFELKDDSGKYIIEIHNAEERLRVDEISIVGDSIKIVMPFYDSEFMLSMQSDSLIGRWTKNYESYKMEMPVKAYYNVLERFEVVNKRQNSDFVGTWNSTFISDDKKDTSNAIAEIRMVDNKIYGTFLSTTGDYRYLEGLTDSNRIYLSAFDGSHVYLFEAEINSTNTELVNGVFYSGYKNKQTWSAKYDQYAKLPDADKLTFLKEGYDELAFEFKNTEGKVVSLKSEEYQNKVVLIQIMGSWCPNCIDETNYLVPFYKENKSNGVEVIGLCYERSEDFAVASKNIRNLQTRLNIPYPLLIAGTNKKGGVNESLPMLNNFLAFPTLIVVDKKGKVRKIHTGYSGPATGKHYIEFKAEFEQFIKQLLLEN
jgi:thiol-disulfide isomerase/thioredoxin